MAGEEHPKDPDDDDAPRPDAPPVKEPAVPENSGSGKQFATGQSETADRQHDEAHSGGEGSGKQFSRGQSPATEHPDPAAPHEAPKGSGQQFSRGQSQHAEDWTEDDVPASGKHFSKDRTGADHEHGDDPHVDHEHGDEGGDTDDA